MSESKPGCYVALCVSSTKMNPDDIESHLGLTPSRKIVMGTPTGEDSSTTHPCHLALFPSRLSSRTEWTFTLSIWSPCLSALLPKLKAIQDRCESVIHCTCVIRDEDGWELSPQLWLAWAGWVSHTVLLWMNKVRRIRANMRLETDLRTRWRSSRTVSF